MEDYARALVSFFAIIDPLGNILVFHLFTTGAPLRRRSVVALIAVTAAFLLLLAFTLGGVEVLDFLGISADSFKVAAGLLLLLPAFRLVTEGQPMRVNGREGLDPIALALVPLAVPLLAGPGALAAATSFADSVGVGRTIAAFSTVLAVSLAGFLSSDWLSTKVGPSPLRLLARIIGVLLFAIAVDFVLDGVREFARS